MYYLGDYAKKFATFPADYDPRTNYQVLIYYEAYITPGMILIAITIFCCYMAFPVLVIGNFPDKWSMIIQFPLGFIVMFLSFFNVATIIGVTIIAYEFLVHFFPTWLEIDPKDIKVKTE